MSPVRHWLPNDDQTNQPDTRPSGTGTATARSLTEDEVIEIAEREKRRMPLGFDAPAKPKRRRKP